MKYLLVLLKRFPWARPTGLDLELQRKAPPLNLKGVVELHRSCGINNKNLNVQLWLCVGLYCICEVFGICLWFAL